MDTLFESEVFAKDAKAMPPFRIVVEEDENDGLHSVTVKRIDYNKIEGMIIAETHILTSSFWKGEK